MLKSYYKVNLEHREHALKGWNWGRAEFSKQELYFNVANKPAFEIPFSEVSNSNLAGKNEIAVEFATTDLANADSGRKGKKKNSAAVDQLVEMRFYVPGTVKKGEGEDGASDNEGEEMSAATLFYDTLKEKADIGEIVVRYPCSSTTSDGKFSAESSSRRKARIVARSLPGARPSPRSMRPGCSVSSVPNCSAMVSGEWFGSITPPDPSRIVCVFAATWAISTLVADDAMDDMLWCSAYQTLQYPLASASCASLTLPSRLSRVVSPRPMNARSRMDIGTDELNGMVPSTAVRAVLFHRRCHTGFGASA